MQQEQLIELSYHSVLRAHYEALSDLPGFVLLESTDIQKGRYDICSAYPYEQVVIQSDTSDLEKELNQLREKLIPKPSAYSLPFQGGAIGYITYDLGALLAGIPLKVNERLSNMPLLNLGFYDWAIISDHWLKKTYLYAANTQPVTAQHLQQIIELWNKPQSNKSFKLTSAILQGMSESYYYDSFYRIKESLEKGRSYQVNFTQAFTVGYEGDAWAAYRNVSQINPVPFAAFLHFNETDILSFSPERYYLYEKGRLLTSPIKGTIGRSADLDEDERLKQQLLSCSKNQAENVMIVDLLRNDLGKIAKTGSVEVTRLCAVESYNAVHHLVSEVRAEVDTNNNPLDIFLSGFPGGSITGAPKLESMRIINELEQHGRGVYCGAVVYFSQHGRFDSNIAIRTVTARDKTLHFSAGGGVVIDSKAWDEYHECLIKIKAIVNGLQSKNN
ncbi:MAG: aminodeoxychorismate synthase, component I [Legionella sp.]|nr:MAG: aminodeoxychorismate synthase, component I [Legionella sp.]PJD99031.1 MAG: aminodeoxychorismate synthase, component I [Legionella sp.]